MAGRLVCTRTETRGVSSVTDFSTRISSRYCYTSSRARFASYVRSGSAFLARRKSVTSVAITVIRDRCERKVRVVAYVRSYEREESRK